MQTSPAIQTAIGKLDPVDIDAVSKLVLECFGRFVAGDYEVEGVETFTRYAAAEAMKARLSNGHSILVARAGTKIAGMIELRGNDHVSLLFVDHLFQGRGVARQLWNCALHECLTLDPSITSVSVNSSKFAVDVYKRLGFHTCGDYRVKDGIGFIPMEYLVTDNNHAQRSLGRGASSTR